MRTFQRSICIICVFVMSVAMLAGCGLFERDQNAYNNLPVMTAGNITITKKQLVDAYYNFGYQYEQDNGMTREEALDATLETLLNREIMVNLALSELYGLTEEQITQARTDKDFPYNQIKAKEQDAARKAAFDALDQSYKSFEDTTREDAGLTVGVPESESAEEGEEETDTANNIYNPYTPLLKKYGTSYRIDVSAYYNEEEVGEVAATWSPKTRVSNPTGTEKKIADEALGALVRRLGTGETGLTFDEDKGKSKSEINANVLQREVMRIAREEAKNKLAGKFEALFNQNLSKPIDKVNGVYNGIKYTDLVSSYGEEDAYAYAVSSLNSNYTEALANCAAEYYKSQVRNAIDRYKKRQDDDAAIGSNLLNSLSEVYYVPESIINQYFSVSHILVGYSESQLEELKSIEALKTKGNLKDYETTLNALRARTGGFMRNEKGEETGKFMTAKEILEFVQGYVTPYDKTQDKTYNPKATGTGYERDIQDIRNAFRECIYMFNTDPGMVNAEYEYVMGVTESGMVESFTAASRELYWNFDKNRQEGKPGAMSGLVWSEHGAHIIMYTRNIGDFIYHNSAAVLENTYSTYLFATQTSYGNKTAFDKAVETLTKPEYTAYETNLIAGFLEGKKVVTVKRNFSDLF